VAIGVGTGTAAAGGTYAAQTLSKSDSSGQQSFEARIAQAFQYLKDHTNDMVNSIASNVSLFDFAVFESKLRDALEPLKGYFNKGVVAGIKSERPENIVVRFDLLHPAIFNQQENHRENLVQSLTDEQRQLVNSVVVNGLANGSPTNIIARNLHNSLGLTPYQSGIVQNYRQDLLELNTNALGRALRDKRYDRTVAKAIKSGIPIPLDQVNKMVSAYSKRYLAMRCNTIARDQSLAAVNLGHITTIRSVASQHGLGVHKTWVAVEDGRTREAHRELDGQSVYGIDTPFDSELGPIKYPYDPDAKPANTIQCRCHLKFKLVPMNAVKDLSDAI
jgi:hypothetical protein